jgi:hypothetical protein
MVFHTESKDEFGNDLIIIKTVGGTLYCFTGIDHPSPVVKHPTKSPDYEAEPYWDFVIVILAQLAELTGQQMR